MLPFNKAWRRVKFGAKWGWEREWGGDEDGTYPPALPKWEGGWARDGCGFCPFGEVGLMRDEIVDFSYQSNLCLCVY